MGLFEWINRHSFLVAGGSLLFGLGVFLLLRRAGWAGWGIWTLILIALIGFWLATRTQPPQQFASEVEIEAALRSGQPVLVYWFSNY